MSETRSAYTTSEAERLVGLYVSLGWKLLPIVANTKKPTKGTKFDECIANPATAEVAIGWLRRGDNIGVLLGDASGGLVCRDFDDELSFETWTKLQPELAARLPRVRTRRGFHVFCRSINPVKTVAFGDGELRSTGAYVVLPPSIHQQSGLPYRWLTEPATMPEVVDVDAADLRRDLGRVTEWNRVHTTDSVNSVHSVDSVHSVSVTTSMTVSQWEQILDVIDQTLPDEVGNRDRCTFPFARRVVFILDGRPDDELGWKIFNAWYSEGRKRGVIGTADPIEGFESFMRSCSSVRIPDSGDDPVTQAFERSLEMPLPSWARAVEQDYGEVPSVKLARLVVAMDEMAEGGVWFLSCHTAGKLVGISNSSANKILRGFERKGILEVVQRGVPGPPGSRANRFQLLRRD